MTKNSSLHRWALLDKSGKTRMTCEASTLKAAEGIIEADRRGGVPIPPGWRIVDQGPVEPEPKPEGKPSACPFKVGDRVERTQSPGAQAINEGTTGEVVAIDHGGIKGRIKVQWSPGGPCSYDDPAMEREHWGNWNALRKVEDAPVPEGTRIKNYLRECSYCGKAWHYGDDAQAFDRGLKEVRDHALACPSNPLVQEIASLKEERDRLKAELDEERRRSELAQQAGQNAERDAQAMESKLADLAALVRAGKVLAATKTQGLAEALEAIIQDAAA
jgi:hypothetical protein